MRLGVRTMNAKARRIMGAAWAVLILVMLGGVACIMSACSEEVPTSLGGLPVIQTKDGPLIANREHGLWVFRGIPYAAPPVGELRWKPPQPVEEWSAPRRADVFGPDCPQPNGTSGRTSEDCLYLNVWSPAESASEHLPVMVWIHGGIFRSGSSSLSKYDASALAREGVVVVTINYRLGPLGFLAHPALSDEDERGLSGNYGLLDQIAALRWVKENISAFGGNPDLVTVFGQSAGGISILDLMVSPLAAGLFQRAIVQSGPMIEWGASVSTADSLEALEAEGEEFAIRLGVGQTTQTPADTLEEMRNRPVADILAAAEDDLSYGRMPWRPAVDGHVLADYPSTLWQAGQQSKVPLLIGFTRDEANGLYFDLPGDAKAYALTVQNIFGEHAEEILADYPAGSDPEDSFNRLLTRVAFAGSARLAAQSTALAGAAAYVYEFTRPAAEPYQGAVHGVDEGYVWGNLRAYSGLLGETTEADEELSNMIRAYWTRFAASGDPNGEGLPEWPRYDTSTAPYLELGLQVTARTDLYPAESGLGIRLLEQP